MITYYDKGQILKGSDVEIVFRLAPQCSTVDFSQVENLTVDFYTNSGGTSIEKTASALSITGATALVHFQYAELDQLSDGVLRYIVTFEQDGDRTVYDLCSQFYLKSPADYTPVVVVTEDNFNEELNKRKYVLNRMEQEEAAALYQELLPYLNVRKSESSPELTVGPDFPVETYKFYADTIFNSVGGLFPVYLRTLDTFNNTMHFEGWCYSTMIQNLRIFCVLHEDGTVNYSQSGVSPVRSLNKKTGALFIKTINGQDLVEQGSAQGTPGNIEIEAGISAESAQTMIESALTDYATSAETAEAISTATQGMVTSTEINKIWTGTQAEYDQISPKLNTTLYFIKES